MGGAAPPEKHQRGCPADRCVAWCTRPRPTPTTALHCRRALHEPPCDALGPPPHTFRPEKAMRCDGRCSALRGHMQHTAMAYAAHCAICPGIPPQEPHRDSLFIPFPQKRKVLRDDNHHAALSAPQGKRPGSIPPGSPCTSWESCPSWHGTPCRGGHGTRSRTPRRWPRCCNGDSR